MSADRRANVRRLYAWKVLTSLHFFAGLGRTILACAWASSVEDKHLLE
jgi:hypothetical protein